MPEERRDAIIAGELPNDCKLRKDLRDKFFENVDIEKLATKEGLALVIQFLDKELGEDDLEKQVRTQEELEDCKRGDKDIEDFIFDFDRAYKRRRVPLELPYHHKLELLCY